MNLMERKSWTRLFALFLSLVPVATVYGGQNQSQVTRSRQLTLRQQMAVAHGEYISSEGLVAWVEPYDSRHLRISISNGFVGYFYCDSAIDLMCANFLVPGSQGGTCNDGRLFVFSFHGFGFDDACAKRSYFFYQRYHATPMQDGVPEVNQSR
jgi:hypothetical protein